MKNLDFSGGKSNEDAVELAKKQYLGETPDGLEDKFIADDEESEPESDSEEEVKDQKPQKRGLLSKFTSSFKNVTGNMV